MLGAKRSVGSDTKRGSGAPALARGLVPLRRLANARVKPFNPVELVALAKTRKRFFIGFLRGLNIGMFKYLNIREHRLWQRKR